MRSSRRGCVEWKFLVSGHAAEFEQCFFHKVGAPYNRLIAFPIALDRTRQRERYDHSNVFERFLQNIVERQWILS